MGGDSRQDGPFRVVELRVHGVGGSTPEALLGEAHPEDAATVADDGLAGFHVRRRDTGLEGYVWGNLTQKPLLQPLWLLLLPFTLVNVSGWMLPPVDRRRSRARRFVRLFRATVWYLAFVLTSIYFLWSTRIVINLLYGMPLSWRPHSANGRIFLALAAMVAIVGLVAYVAGYRQTKFERYLVPRIVREREEPRLGARKDVGKFWGLNDPKFWWHPTEARNLLIAHVALALGCVGWMVRYALDHTNAHVPPLRTHNGGLSLSLVFPPTLAVELALFGLLFLAFLHWALWRRPKGFWTAREHVGFRWAGPVVAATTGISLATELFYGLTLAVYKADPDTRALGVAFGLGTVTLGATVIGFVIWLLVGRHRELKAATHDEDGGRKPWDRRYVRPNDPRELIDSKEPVGATTSVYRRLAFARIFSELGRNADLLLFTTVPVFIVAALWQLMQGHPFTRLGWAAPVGQWVSRVGATAVLGFLMYRSMKPGERKIVGIIWDVLTFWPRRFHPLAVRPYAERSVPELQHRLLHHISDSRTTAAPGAGRPVRVILSTHSQGTVLGYAALVQLPDDVLANTAFVTYGSPLRQLHEMAFPAFFAQDDFHRLRRDLWPPGADDERSWRSFFRHTDYVGKRVFQNGEIDHPLPDPAEQPSVAAQGVGATLPPAFPDPPRGIWVELARHSFYNREVALKEHLAALKYDMAEEGPLARLFRAFWGSGGL